MPSTCPAQPSHRARGYAGHLARSLPMSLASVGQFSRAPPKVCFCVSTRTDHIDAHLPTSHLSSLGLASRSLLRGKGSRQLQHNAGLPPAPDRFVSISKGSRCAGVLAGQAGSRELQLRSLERMLSEQVVAEVASLRIVGARLQTSWAALGI